MANFSTKTYKSMDFDKELDAPTATTNSGTNASAAPADPGDVMLARPADGGLFDAMDGALDLGDLLAEGVNEVLTMQGPPDVPPIAGQQDSAPVAGQPFRSATPTAQKGTVVKLDATHAAAAATFYVEVILPSVFTMMGSAIVGDKYRYKELDKNFKKTYMETVKILAQSGELSMPTPMQCFIVMTLFIVINNGLEMWKIKKAENKAAKRAGAKDSRKLVDESAPVHIGEEFAQKLPKPSDISVEMSKRTRFVIEDGFYTYDLSGVYIPKKDRVFGPSKKVQQIVDSYGTDAKTVKKMLEDAYAKPSQARTA